VGAGCCLPASRRRRAAAAAAACHTTTPSVLWLCMIYLPLSWLHAARPKQVAKRRARGQAGDKRAVCRLCAARAPRARAAPSCEPFTSRRRVVRSCRPPLMGGPFARAALPPRPAPPSLQRVRHSRCRVNASPRECRARARACRRHPPAAAPEGARGRAAGASGAAGKTPRRSAAPGALLGRARGANTSRGSGCVRRAQLRRRRHGHRRAAAGRGAGRYTRHPPCAGSRPPRRCAQALPSLCFFRNTSPLTEDTHACDAPPSAPPPPPAAPR
jgi:hypothetical protein